MRVIQTNLRKPNVVYWISQRPNKSQRYVEYLEIIFPTIFYIASFYTMGQSQTL